MPTTKEDQALEKVFDDTRVRDLSRDVYPFRVVGLLCGIFPSITYAYQNDYALVAFCWPLFIGLIWPHLAYAWAQRSSNPTAAESRNLLFDTFLSATIVPFINFCLLPSVVICAIVLADKANSTVSHLIPKAVLALIAGVVFGLIFWDGIVTLNNSFEVMLATLPVMIIHTSAVAINNVFLIRRFRKNNHFLRKLTQTDALSGADSRAYWLYQAKKALQNDNGDDQCKSVLIIDIDHFKEINDRCGHNVGDQVIVHVAKCLVLEDRRHGFVGRLGGDEFAVFCFLPLAKLENYVNDTLLKVSDLRFDDNPDLAISLSIGVVRIENTPRDVAYWVEQADNALYQAKAQGRNGAVFEGFSKNEVQ